MKRVLTWVLRLAVAGVLLLVVALVATVTTVDRTPWDATSAGRQTEARLARLASSSNLVFGPLRAGFGRARLTPGLGADPEEPAQGRFRSVPLAGYGARAGKPATGVHEDVWAKAVAFAVAGRTGVIVAADALIIPPEVSRLALRRLAEARGLSREQVYFSATHTHASLGGWGQGFVAESFAGGFVPGIREWFAGQLAAAALAAVDDLRPAEVGETRFAAPQYVRNRLLGDAAPKDPEFLLVQVRQGTGARAFLGSYAAHATVLPASNFEFSGDYPGFWALALEHATGGMAVFLAGGVGSHGPQAGAPGFEGARRMGEVLAEESLRHLTGLRLSPDVTFGLAGVWVALPPLQVRLSDGWRLRPWVARQLLPVGPETYLQGLRLGEGLWLSTPCDFSGELALDVKAEARSRHLTAGVTSFNGDYVGYVIPARYYGLDGYEPRTMSFFGPQLPDQFRRVLSALTAALADAR